MPKTAVKKSSESTFQATCFQVHKSLLAENSFANVIDFTEKKLCRQIEESKDALKKLMLVAMLEDYTTGNIAISWKHSLATYTRITQDKK